MARKKKSVGGMIATFILLLVVLIIIAGAIFEILVTPSYSKIKNKYENNDNVGVVVTSGETLGIKPAVAAAATELYVYGYQNSSVVEDVEAFVLITNKVTKNDDTTTYTAAIIYFDSMKDAITARDGIKDKVKEKGKVAMFRGKALVIGEKEAVLKYYAVIF